MSEREEARKLVRELHRPSTWSRPAAPGEVIGNPERTETVRIESDADLATFVRSVLDYADEIRSGRLRFRWGASSSPDVMRVAHGAVTERTIRKAAEAGGRLVLGPGAVLTPLAREKARALGVDIERER